MKLIEIINDPGLYIGVRFTNNTLDNLDEFCKKHEIPHTLAKEKFHATIIYSEKYVKVIPEIYSEKIDPNTYQWKKLKDSDSDKNNCLVLSFQSAKLEERFNEALEAGAETDYPEYIPHITLSYNAAKFDISSLPLPTFPLIIEEEYQTALNKNWT